MSSMILNKLKSPKWESKVIGIQWLQDWIIENQVPPNLTEYAFRILKGAMKEWKEINSNLTKSSSECIFNILSTAQRLGRRSIGIIIPYLWEKLADRLVKNRALDSILLCAELNNNSIGSISYTVKQLIKYGPKTLNNLVLKEIFSCIVLIVDNFGTQGIQLNEIFKFIVFGCGHKTSEVRNEAILVIKQFYKSYGYDILSYLIDIKPSTMTVINQELESVLLSDELLARKEGILDHEKEQEIEEEEKYTDSGTKLSQLMKDKGNQEQEYEEEIKNPPQNNLLSSSVRKSIRKSQWKSSNASLNASVKPKRASKHLDLVSQKETEYLKILDVGNKDSRERKDVKIVWCPNKLRTDVLQQIRVQIKAAFGVKFEKNWFSNDFKKHIECLKLFETWFEPEYPQIDHFFCIIDLMLKWIFIKGCEGSNINTKFLIEILNFLHSLIQFLITQGYELMEGEGIILLTFLIEKVNATNTSIRENVKDQIFEIWTSEALYPLKASFKLVMAGVQNKNSKIK